eukprot:12915728-Prorocentrum_lima.AAC.1
MSWSWVVKCNFGARIMMCVHNVPWLERSGVSSPGLYLLWGPLVGQPRKYATSARSAQGASD